MYNDRFLNYIFILSVLIAFIFPLINIYYIYPSFGNLIRETTEEDATRLANHLRSAIVTDDGKLKKPDTFFYDITNMKREFDLKKLKVFSESGKTIYSSDSKDVGIVNNGHIFNNIVAKGRSYTATKREGTRSVEGEKVSGELVEIYIPIMNGNEFLGAFEIYYDISKRINSLDILIFNYSLIPLAMMLFFLLLIDIILYKADNNIIILKGMENELRENHEVLENRAEQSGPGQDSFTV